MAKKPGIGERACPKCKETIKADALICKHCRTEFTPEEMAQAKKDAQYNNKLAGFGCLIVVLMLGFCTYVVGDEKPISNDAPVSEHPSTPVTAAVVQEPASNLSGPQQNAERSARQYLSMSGFSRNGLIDQLSSDSGDGYALADATAAVNNLNVDWNEQAARSAQQYLRMSGFSCNGLIDQLSSSAGDQYTKSQATFGAKQAGAC